MSHASEVSSERCLSLHQVLGLDRAGRAHPVRAPDNAWSFQRLVPHPVLHGSYVETSPEHAGGIRGPEGLQIEFFGIEAGAFSDQFAASQEVLFPIAGR